MPPKTRSKRKHQEAELREELRRCTERGNLDRVRELVLIERVNVNSSDEKGFTTLHWAVNFGRADVARFLVENGADVERACSLGMTTLGYAIYFNEVAVAEVLLEYGADVDKRLLYLPSPLGLAIGQRNVRMVALLLRFGAKTDEVLLGRQLCSATHASCVVNNVEILQLVLDHGGAAKVNVFVRSRGGCPPVTPLCMACTHNNMEIARLLIQSGARVVFSGCYPTVPSPLIKAVVNRSLELVRFLLTNSPFSSAPANENTLPPATGGSHALTKPLEFALGGSKLEVAQLLVDYGADVNSGSLLCKCAYNGWYDGARFLFQAGANVNQANRESGSKTPLWIAAENGDSTFVEECLKARADVNIRDDNGETPLGVAQRKGHMGATYLLLRTSPHVWSRLERHFVSAGRRNRPSSS